MSVDVKSIYRCKLPVSLANAANNVNILCLGTFFPFLNFKFYSLAFRQRPESHSQDVAVMDKNIAPTIPLDKAIPLGVIKPLHITIFTTRHNMSPFSYLFAEICQSLLIINRLFPFGDIHTIRLSSDLLQ